MERRLGLRHCLLCCVRERLGLHRAEVPSSPTSHTRGEPRPVTARVSKRTVVRNAPTLIFNYFRNLPRALT
jgi:hypothetical protein